ncbi:MAG: hypothetical protein LAP85_26475 [Acidobacteriia bacterium]|nr:hypothetical protein [Terriglobia bacterium]
MHDKNLESSLSNATNATYVCFRPGVDEFFLVSFNKPSYLNTRWDKNLKQLVIGDDATAQGNGYTSAFNKGIPDGRTVPNFVFAGTWHHFSESWGGDTFESDRTNFKRANESKQRVLVIDASQISIQDFQYTNSESKTIHYNLTIQRSTGRFSETFLGEDNKVPFIDRSGRCLVQSK